MNQPDYAARAALHQHERDMLDARARAISWGRLLLFAGLCFGAYELAVGKRSWTTPEGIAALTFIVVATWHRRVREAARFAEARRAACAAGTARVARDWASIAPATWTDAFIVSPQMAELHIAGPQSLARLLPPLSPVAGRPVIWRWLSATEPPLLTILHERQTAVRELVPLFDWRDRLSVFASRVRGRMGAFDGFVQWSASGPAGTQSAFAQWGARLLAAGTVVAVVGATNGLLEPAIATTLLFVNLALVQRARRRLNAVLADMADGDRRIGGLSHLFGEAAAPAFDAPRLRELHERLGGDAGARALGTLERIVSFGDLRFSPMAHVVAQALTLWDLHVLGALESWQRHHGASVAVWLAALGEVEATAAIATLAYDNPSWTFPEIEDGDGSVECAALAHPILPAATRVANDVAFGPAGRVLLVTGPNMAGKSTLLRAIGLNMSLAQIGSPVCAAHMRLPRVRLRTSIHAVDALEEGVSLFMAELLRVKHIVEDSQKPSDVPVLYVVDEMLRGTNAEERHVAVTRVLQHLVAAGAIGVVSTHDVALAREPELADTLTSVHFAAQFGENGGATLVSFDYRLRPGPATGRNAIRLLEMMGLG